LIVIDHGLGEFGLLAINSSVGFQLGPDSERLGASVIPCIGGLTDTELVKNNNMNYSKMLELVDALANVFPVAKQALAICDKETTVARQMLHLTAAPRHQASASNSWAGPRPRKT
jgi:hypothetical protein